MISGDFFNHYGLVLFGLLQVIVKIQYKHSKNI